MVTADTSTYINVTHKSFKVYFFASYALLPTWINLKKIGNNPIAKWAYLGFPHSF